MSTTVGVGMCLAGTGALIAVARPDPVRLTALGGLAWPAELWDPAGAESAWSTAQRALTRARKKLDLPRWCPVSVVVGPTLHELDALPTSSALLARAGLSQGWVATADQALRIRTTVNIAVEGRLGPAAAGLPADLAIGAALIAVGAAHPAALAAGRQMSAEDEPDGTGWAVVRIDDEESVEPIPPGRRGNGKRHVADISAGGTGWGQS